MKNVLLVLKKTINRLPSTVCRLLIISLVAMMSLTSCSKLIFEQEIDRLLTTYSDLDKFNGVVMAVKNGKVVYKKGFGYANAELKKPNDENGIFTIYSITKTMTSTVIFKLIEEGKISLNTKLSEFYPTFPNADKITIEHLLTHTSGIFNYTNEQVLTNFSEDSMLTYLATKPLEFEPGSQWQYCNSGYALLGHIIEKVTNSTYEKQVRKYIFKPLGMTNSGFDFKNLDNSNKVVGYEILTNEEQKIAPVPDSTVAYAAGAVYSTLDDLYKFHQAMQNHKIISKASTEKAYTPTKVNDNYAYGWATDLLFGKRTIEHSGGFPGFRTMLKRIEKDNTCVILLCNHDAVNVDAISNKILKILYHQPIEMPKEEIEVPIEQLEKYVGTYRADDGICLYVTLENGRLFGQPSMEGKQPLLAQEENYFYVDGVEAFIRFSEDENYNKVILADNGKKLEAKRITAIWGITGSATPNGWEGEDISLQSEDGKIWKANNVLLKKGEFKFRFNNEWTINYGIGAASEFLIPFGDNIPVEAGDYAITLDLTDESKPKYRINEN